MTGMNGSRPFRREYLVRIDDINYGGHMGNERALVVFQDARIAFLQSGGMSELDVGGGAGLILVEANVRFLAQVKLGDVLETCVAASGIRRSSFDLHYTARRKGDGVDVLAGWTRLLPFDYASGRVVRIPEVLSRVLESAQRQP